MVIPPSWMRFPNCAYHGHIAVYHTPRILVGNDHVPLQPRRTVFCSRSMLSSVRNKPARVHRHCTTRLRISQGVSIPQESQDCGIPINLDISQKFWIVTNKSGCSFGYVWPCLAIFPKTTVASMVVTRVFPRDSRCHQVSDPGLGLLGNVQPELGCRHAGTSPQAGCPGACATRHCLNRTGMNVSWVAKHGETGEQNPDAGGLVGFCWNEFSVVTCCDYQFPRVMLHEVRIDFAIPVKQSKRRKA